MKKILLILVTPLCLVLSCSQANNEAVKVLKKELVETNKGLPKSAAFFTLTKMEIKGNDYLVYGTVDEEQMDFDELMTNLNHNKAETFNVVSGRHVEFAKLFVESGLNLKFIIMGIPSMRKDQLVLTSDEIKWEYGLDEKTAKEFLSSYTASVSKELPYIFEGGVSQTALYIDGKYLYTVFQTDESEWKIARLREIQSEGKAMEISIIDGCIESNDTINSRIIKALRTCGMGWKHVYNSTRTSASVTFTMTHDLIESRYRLY